MKKIILYDDYNRLIHMGWAIGTVVQNFGRMAWRNGWKIIEVYKDETEDNTDRHDMEERGKRLGLP